MTVVTSCNPIPVIPSAPAPVSLPEAVTSPVPLERELALLEIIARIAALEDVDQAYQELSEHLQRWLNVRQVVLGVERQGRQRCQVKAISGTRTISRQSRVVQSLEAAMNEAVMRNEIDAMDLKSIDGGKATVIQKELAYATNSTIVVSGPLRTGQGQAVGAWVALDSSPEKSAEAMAASMRAAEPRIGLCFDILSRHQRGKIPARLSSLLDTKRRSRRLVLLGIGVAVAVVLAIPLPYKVSCECDVQPVTRRYVVAPYDGMLEQALVEPGDLVRSGQVVARMDGRETQWELAGLVAELNRAQKERDTSLAGLDTAAAQLSRLEMERLKLKIRVLENRAQNLEIKSPVDGVVISGDPKKMEGARLTVGQTLFEIGPVDQMQVQVAVPDEDISHVADGQPVTIRFESQPTRKYTGQVKKIHPRAEVKEQANVFIAEVALSNEDGTLRPGMYGRARVRTASHPVAWNLFHKVWQRVAFRMGW
jgi:RND family efflux transporter MFP subunit